MKKVFYLQLFVLFIMTAVFSKAEGQYHFTSITRLDTIPQSNCGDTVSFRIQDDIPFTMQQSYTLHIYYGDGSSEVISGYSPDTISNVIATHYYPFPGHYSIKFVLIDSSAGMSATDSIREPINVSSFCHNLPLQVFIDIAGTGVYDSSADLLNTNIILVEASQNGIPVDTITLSSGIYYNATGAAGDVYSFRIISSLGSYIVSCPSGAILYDTISATPILYSSKYFGLGCTSTGNFDLEVNADLIAGRHAAQAEIILKNNDCNPVSANATMIFSPKYVFVRSYPSPSSMSGNTVVWSLPALSSSNPISIGVDFTIAGANLIPGDTIVSSYLITPTVGDVNPANNYIAIVDTVTISFDPNEMSVTPSGYITSGTQLKYTINFENTGNDTAFNISVYDTLSDNVDVKTLNLVSVSAAMNIAMLNIGGHNIVKFDFPNINLLDSSHHGQCDGMIIFTVNAKNGLLNGTTIFNHAGIFFDDNPVVMTDTVEDVIGIPASTTVLTNTSKVEIFPNPANDELTVKVDNGSYSTVTVTNMLRQQLIKQAYSNSQVKINVKTLPAGIYYITLRGDSGVKVQQFVKM